MRFQIESVQTDGIWVPLSDSRVNNTRDNVFTMIVGQNAVGKSRLLRKIVSNYIFSRADEDLYSHSITRDHYSSIEQHAKYVIPDAQLHEHFPPSYLSDTDNWNSLGSRRSKSMWDYHADNVKLPTAYFDTGTMEVSHINYDGNEVMPSPGSAWMPSHVIAVSTGRHDRFPSTAQYKKRIAPTNYSYIGTERPHGSSVPSSLASLIDGLLKGSQNTYKLSKIFEYLEFIPYLDIKVSLDTKQINKLSDVESSELYYNCRYGLIEFLLAQQDDIPYSDSHRVRFYEAFRRQKKSHIEVDFWSLDRGVGQDILSDMAPLLKAGIVKIYDVTLIKAKDKSRLRLSQASSGQQCMMTIMLGIAGSIQNGALICIDEPEISLHPQWQSNLVKQLQEIFSEYHGCHFIIATHSPQLVSGLVTENGYVLNLEEKKLYHSYEYAKRSADFQLAEIFQSPGQNNEYLLRMTLLLLTKITRRENFDKDDYETAHKLFQIREKMSDADPVYHLIGQLESLY
jgi:predicted ATPase